MSYILEALKKSQAERQLGSAPTLQAVPLGAAPLQAARKSRLPWIAIGGVALALAIGVAVWRVQTPVVQPAATVILTPPPAPVAVAPPAPVVVAPPPALAVVPPSAPASKPAPVVQPVAAPAQEKLPFLRELPDAIQRMVPQVTFGGYMYSANPADRLILVDKVLRHEGEEVAPGLMLEKLQPRAAVMNYKGYRYLVPY